jgi:hypothetical protein
MNVGWEDMLAWSPARRRWFCERLERQRKEEASAFREAQRGK